MWLRILEPELKDGRKPQWRGANGIFPRMVTGGHTDETLHLRVIVQILTDSSSDFLDFSISHMSSRILHETG